MHDPIEFDESLSGASPPDGLDPALQALWWSAKGDWDRAHEVAGERQEDAACNRVHAHLHRAEGDERSAAHWYAQSGHAASDLPLEEEWRVLVHELLTAHATPDATR